MVAREAREDVNDWPALTGVGLDPALLHDDEAWLVPLPDAAQELIVRARREGLAVRNLYYTRVPLSPHSDGGWIRETQDIWVLWREDADARYRTLFHELAHASGCPQEPRTIDADWDEEDRAVREAPAIARRYGYPDLYPSELLARELAHVDLLREVHHLAAEWAGLPDTEPLMARRAVSALLAHLNAGQQHAQHAQHAGHSERIGYRSVREVLLGIAADVDLAERAIDLDRAALRECHALRRSLRWPGFGPHTRTHPNSAETLSRALADSRTVRALAEEPASYARIDGPCGLPEALALLQRALLAQPDAQASARWGLYTDTPTDVSGGDIPPGRAEAVASRRMTSGASLYHLEVYYGLGMPVAHVWVLLTESQADDECVAALQRYIRGWAQMSELELGTLSEGLALLWEQWGAAQLEAQEAQGIEGTPVLALRCALAPGLGARLGH